jgi:hypothetical protein
MDGFYIFPVDIWKLLIYNYIDDFKTLQNLSTMNKRMRGFFREYQLKMREKYNFGEEKRIYDVDFKKLDVSYKILRNHFHFPSFGWIYLLYKHDNILVNIDIDLKNYLDNDIDYTNLKNLKSETNWTWGKTFLKYQAAGRILAFVDMEDFEIEDVD